MYPMHTPSREAEKSNQAVLHVLKENCTQGFELKHESEALEGTGSLVIDLEGKVVYCSQSQRASGELLQEFMEKLKS